MPAEEDTEDGYDVNAYQRLHEDAQRTLDEHLAVFSDEAEKGSRIAQFNGLVLTLVITVVSASNTPIGPFMTIPIGIGLVLLVMGVVLGIFAQWPRHVTVGPGTGDIEIVESERMNEEEYLRWILNRGYTQWIDEAQQKGHKKARLNQISSLISSGGILSLLGGVIWVIV